MTEIPHVSVAVIGGSQAGLSMSYYLSANAIDHVVFEKNRVAHAWRTQRWDTFCLVTPNWQCKLPGFDYPGEDPQGFMKKDEIVRYIENFAASFQPPIRESVEVFKLRKSDSGSCFELNTSIGDWTADQVVVAVGGYHIPMIPRSAERLPEDVVQLHSSQYKNPGS